MAEIHAQLAESGAQLAAIRRSAGHIAEYGKQSQIPISSNNNMMFPLDRQYSFISDMQPVMSGNVTVNIYPEEASAAHDAPNSLHEEGANEEPHM